MVTRVGFGAGQRRKTYFREWREARGMTLEQVATKLGTTKSVLSKIELGKSNYNRDNLEGLAEVYGCTPGDLISRPPDVSEQQAFSGLSPEALKVLAKLIKEAR